MEKSVSQLSHPLWAPFALMFLGVWQLLAPGTFGFLDTSLGRCDIFCGLALLYLGWEMRRSSKSWILWVAGLIGVWLEFAPIAMRIPQAAGYLNDTLVGVLAVFFSLLLANPRDSKGRHIPKGWSYNPSSYVQRLPVIALTVVAWFLARYLAAYQLGFIHTMWDPFFGHGTIDVITSEISKSLPVPDAGLGAFAYTLEFLLGCHGGRARWRTAPWLVLSFGLLVVPVGLVSILLITLQPLVVHAWCTICLLTAFTMLIMIMLAIDEVTASLQLIRRGKRAGLSYKEVLFSGWPEESEHTDPREVPLDAPLKRLIRAFCRGCSAPWNLLLSTLLGAEVMMLPARFQLTSSMANVDHILGALIVVVSMISMAEVIRKARFVLWVFAAVIVIVALLTATGAALAVHVSISALLILLAIRRGALKETYG